MPDGAAGLGAAAVSPEGGPDSDGVETAEETEKSLNVNVSFPAPNPTYDSSGN